MVWPETGKRSSGSRRDARGRLLGGALSVAAVGLGLALLLIDHFAPGRLASLRTAALSSTAPIWSATRTPVAVVSGWASSVGNYWDAVGRAKRLDTELVAARKSADAGLLFASENRRLKRLLRFSEADRRRVAVARVAGGSGASLVETAVISAGTAAGVRVGQPVLTDAGLLGRVTEVAPSAARVLLVSDSESRVPVRVVRTGVPAVLAGVGGGMTELRFMSAGPETVLHVGDLLVTSGEGGLFAPDIPVARIVALKGETARAEPIARADTLGIAVVEQAWLPTPAAPTSAQAAAASAMATPIRVAAMVNP